MHTAVTAQIDSFHSDSDTSQRSFGHCIRRTNEGNHRPVVIRIYVSLQHRDARDRADGALDGVYDRSIAPLRKIRNALDQLAGHFTSDFSSSTVPRFITRSTRFTPK